MINIKTAVQRNVDDFLCAAVFYPIGNFKNFLSKKTESIIQTFRIKMYNLPKKFCEIFINCGAIFSDLCYTIVNMRFGQKNEQEGVKSMSDKEKKQEQEKTNIGKAFCFCVGEIVDCLPGVVLDCNNKRTVKCPLVIEAEKKEQEKLEREKQEQSKQGDTDTSQKKKDKEKSSEPKKDNRAFCFCVGEQVDCLPGVVLDCNNHRTTKCPLVEEAERKEREEREKEEAASDSRASDNKKSSDSKKDNRSFCFCMGTQVDCLPGVVLDCNNHRTTVCPLVMEVLTVNEEKEEQVKKLKDKYKKRPKSQEDEKSADEDSKQKDKEGKKSKSKSKKDKAKKEEAQKNEQQVEVTYRNFCFCMGTLVSCDADVVQECNNERTQICPVLLEALPVDEEDKAMIDELRPTFDMDKW